MARTRCRLVLTVEYDDAVTDPEELSTAFDVLLETAMSTPGVLDDVGNPSEYGFYAMDGSNIQFDHREMATVLAALRYWQRDLAAHAGAVPIREHFEEVPPLTDAEIEALCQRLNFEAAKDCHTGPAGTELPKLALVDQLTALRREIAGIIEASGESILNDEGVDANVCGRITDEIITHILSTIACGQAT